MGLTWWDRSRGQPKNKDGEKKGEGREKEKVLCPPGYVGLMEI